MVFWVLGTALCKVSDVWDQNYYKGDTFAVVFDPGCAASFTIDPGGFASAGRKTQWLESIFATLTPSPITIVGAAWLDNLIATARIIKEICCIIRM